MEANKKVCFRQVVCYFAWGIEKRQTAGTRFSSYPFGVFKMKIK